MFKTFSVNLLSTMLLPYECESVLQLNFCNVYILIFSDLILAATTNKRTYNSNQIYEPAFPSNLLISNSSHHVVSMGAFI